MSSDEEKVVSRSPLLQALSGLYDRLIVRFANHGLETVNILTALR